MQYIMKRYQWNIHEWLNVILSGKQKMYKVWKKKKLDATAPIFEIAKY